MGGNAFKTLHCPRIPTEVYAKVKTITTNALEAIFNHVTVPFEIPGKSDFGDIDFLVSAPFGDCSTLSLTTFPFATVIEAIKDALGTPHGRRGFLTPDCMYFAIPLPTTANAFTEGGADSSDEELVSWVQVDVKICFKPEMFSWMTFGLNYASQSGVLGSMVKPLGLTLDPEGLHIRVQEMEDTDRPGSMVWVTRHSWTVCRILGLGRRVVDGGFESSEEKYAASWLFHPEHFRARLEEESYLVQHNHRSYFLKKWIPERYPDYEFDTEEAGDGGIQAWTARTRTAVREKVFTHFPHVAAEYYTKRAQHTKAAEERRLRDLISNAIPSGTAGWSDDFPLPHIHVRESIPSTPATMQHGALTPPASPMHQPTNLKSPPSQSPLPISQETPPPLSTDALPGQPRHACKSTPSPPRTSSINKPWETPLSIDTLPRQPPRTCKPTPPPSTMSPTARLSCLARWTFFSAAGVPYLLRSPHAKDFNLQWRDAIACGASEEALLRWASEVWWCVWVRQCVVNWRGMWARRFEKEGVGAEEVGVQNGEVVRRFEKAPREAGRKAEELVRKNREKMLERLDTLNRVLGLLVEVEK
ncbi:uncharacterized protein EKO05_0006530 [Ascochyta rabiei]|uniref:uncharacterized protein n=1 Tax=Didymella rabiei TaxID=5454 RepID=UPI0022015D06|nr:uncharacterized protein EKO05_0006530 [Ascochyta rabiei]UPX16107.1 hypothetical protein EKO05_0006530 [Ascochyta rabiei]